MDVMDALRYHKFAGNAEKSKLLTTEACELMPTE